MTEQESNPTSDHIYREADHFGHTEGIFTVTQAEAAGRCEFTSRTTEYGPDRHLTRGLNGKPCLLSVG